jgi:hypothetical protein
MIIRRWKEPSQGFKSNLYLLQFILGHRIEEIPLLAGTVSLRIFRDKL